MSSDYQRDEYFALLKIIADSDQRLLTVKGWGVTLSLVALGLAFQYRAFGFFIVAAVSSSAFWIVEHASRRPQMRHYVRMREIEVNEFESADTQEKHHSSPRIDWSWSCAPLILSAKVSDDRSQPVTLRAKNPFYRIAGLLPHVALPHALTLVVSYFAYWGFQGELAGFELGVPSSTAR